MRVPIDEQMRDRLRKVRASQWEDMLAGQPEMVDEVFLEQEVVRLMSGGGHAAYLGLNGQITTVNYGEGFPPGVLNDPKDVASVLFRWAGSIGMPELIDLLPRMPEDGEVCSLCNGNRYMPPEVLGSPDGQRLYCRRCGGLGWTDASRNTRFT